MPEEDIRFVQGLCLIGAALFLLRLLLDIWRLVSRELP
jgi:hypothetical protein